jgi:hypothetical protein
MKEVKCLLKRKFTRKGCIVSPVTYHITSCMKEVKCLLKRKFTRKVRKVTGGWCEPFKILYYYYSFSSKEF